MADVKNMPAPLGAAIDPFEDYEDGLTPHARAMASSIIMGFAFGLGGLFTAPLGAVADSFGLHVTMVILGIAPVFALPAVLSFPPQNRR